MKARMSISIAPRIRRGVESIAQRRGVTLSALTATLYEQLIESEAEKKRFPCTTWKGPLKSKSPALDHDELAWADEVEAVRDRMRRARKR